MDEATHGHVGAELVLSEVEGCPTCPAERSSAVLFILNQSLVGGGKLGGLSSF
jgi:hypothetical protein